MVEYHRSAADPDTIDRTQRRVLISLIKQTADHNGGMMQFGPDGYLYIAIGDGGADPPRVPVGVTGQTLNDLFGSILRIDPRNGTPYVDPGDQPVRLDARRKARDRRVRPPESVALLDRSDARDG